MVASGTELDPAIGALLGETTTEIAVARKNRVFCTRNLRMDSIELTLGKLIAKHGYPVEIRSLHYDPRWAIRGLMVDRQLGNVFKMDRHAYVGRCNHGFRALSHDERRRTYRNEKINLSSDRFEWIDTQFGLPEAVKYQPLVDWADRTTGTVDYAKQLGDVRTALDAAHRDDTLKNDIKANLPA